MPSTYDVVVIGGGIQGVGIAQAAAAAGHRVILLEQQGIATQTSSRSSKLIHGGLRYLETGQFSLVYKALAEREILLRIAPDLVQRKPFYIPVYRQTYRRPWKITAGLMLYALLGRLQANARFRRIERSDWSQMDGLLEEDLQIIFQYWDAQTDDAMLTRAVMLSALELGAELRCPARFCGAQKTRQGYEVQYLQNDVQHQLVSRSIVNAAGPWVNDVLELIQPQGRRVDIELVQGAHILLDSPAPQGIYYVEAADKRVVFVMPWKGATLVGTTESVCHGNAADAQPGAHEVNYLLEVYRHYFPHGSANIIEQFAGVRVLPLHAGSAFSRPRDTIIHNRPEGVLSLYGGKLTGYRATAQEVLACLKPFLSDAKSDARSGTRAVGDTAVLPLRITEAPLTG